MNAITFICLFWAFVSTQPSVSLLPFGSQISSTSKQSLRLVGEVVRLEKISEDNSMVGFKIELRLTINNESNETIIIYRNKPWLGAVDIAGSLSDASSNTYLHRASAWPNNWGQSDRLAFRKQLDQLSPPADITSVLKPGESWKYDAVAWVGFDKKESYDGNKKAWNEIMRHDPVWLQITLEMWPVNAEPLLDTKNPTWGKELRERWKKDGNLWLDYLKSEPIKLNLSQ